jgi:hypothetical protein
MQETTLPPAPAPELLHKVCLHDGRPFTTYYPQKQYCCGPCRKRAQLKRARERDKEVVGMDPDALSALYEHESVVGTLTRPTPEDLALVCEALASGVTMGKSYRVVQPPDGWTAPPERMFTKQANGSWMLV